MATSAATSAPRTKRHRRSAPIARDGFPADPFRRAAGRQARPEAEQHRRQQREGGPPPPRRVRRAAARPRRAASAARAGAPHAATTRPPPVTATPASTESTKLSVRSWRTSRQRERPERPPNLEFALSGGDSRQQQVGGVGAGDEQHDRHAGDENQQHRPHAAGQLLVQPRHRDLRRVRVGGPAFASISRSPAQVLRRDAAVRAVR